MSIKKHWKEPHGSLNLCCVQSQYSSKSRTCLHTDTTCTHMCAHTPHLPPLFKTQRGGNSVLKEYPLVTMTAKNYTWYCVNISLNEKIISGNNGTKILALLSWLKIQPWEMLAAICDQVCEITMKRLSEERAVFVSLALSWATSTRAVQLPQFTQIPLVFTPVWVDSMSTVITAQLIRDNPDTSFLTYI